MTSKYNINGFAFEDFKVIGDDRVLYSFGNYKDEEGDTFEIHVEYNIKTKEFEFEKLYLEDLSEPCFLDIYPEDISPDDIEELKRRVLAKVREMEENSFRDMCIELLANGAEITTREALIKFAEDMENVNRELSNHIYDALEQNYAEYYKYDFEMGTEETPVELTSLEDLKEFFADFEDIVGKKEQTGFYVLKDGNIETKFENISDFLDAISEKAIAFEENGEEEFKVEIKY